MTVQDIIDNYSPEYRNRVKALALQRFEAIKKMGGRCERCRKKPTTPIEFAIFEFHHKNGNLSEEDNRKVIRKILKGETQDYMLLCKNCHTIMNHIDQTKLYFTEHIKEELWEWIWKNVYR